MQLLIVQIFRLETVFPVKHTRTAISQLPLLTWIASNWSVADMGSVCVHWRKIGI